MRPWWERIPDRYEREVAALRAAGYEVTDERKDTAASRLVITFLYLSPEGLIRLVAHFPVEYPWLPPAIFAPDLNLERHLHPLSRNVCLLGNPDDWDFVRDTMATLVGRQMPRVLSTARDPDSDETAQQETQQGEPWSAYPNYPDGPHLIVGDISIPDGIDSGRLRWKRLSMRPLRGVVMDVLDEDGNVIAATTERWREYASKGADSHGSWKRLLKNPPIDSAEAHFRSVKKPSAFTREQDLARLAVTLFPEEAPWRNRGDGWIVSAQRRVDARSPVGFDWVRVGYGDDQQLFARTPELIALRDKQVLLVGLGMLGSHCAIELARMGVGKLMLADYDYVELSTTTRWALGADYAGILKGD